MGTVDIGAVRINPKSHDDVPALLLSGIGEQFIVNRLDTVV